jgi:glycosyltransferase involved in cell wall biosynthesis
MANSPTLSVLMPNYNHAHYLRDAIQAILAQSFSAIEIIVLDDASTDDSYEILLGIARKDPRLRVFRNERNLGVLESLRRLLEMASGDYIYGAACDDRVLPGFLEKSMRLLAIHPEAGLCSTLSRVIDAEGKDRGILKTVMVSTEPAYISPERARKFVRWYGSWIQGNTTIYRREALVSEGGFPPELHAFTDGFTSLVLALKYGACYIPEPLGVWRYTPGGYAAVSSAKAEVKREMVENATRLMRTKYGDLFPPGFAEEWREVCHFEWGRTMLTATRGQHEEFLEKADLLRPSSSWWGRFLRTVERGAMRTLEAGTFAYLFFRSVPWLAVRQQLHSRACHRRLRAKTSRSARRTASGVGRPESHTHAPGQA